VQLAGTDPGGRSLTLEIAAQPAHGTLSAVDATGKVVYTATAGYTGPDEFSFTAGNGVIVSKPATVSIAVHPNTVPVAVSGAANTDENQAVQIQLNGSAPSGQPFTFAVGQPSNGNVSLNGSTATYTPTRYFFGTDSFTFTVDDGYLTSAPATVTVTVQHVNQPPVVTLTAPSTVNENAPGVSIAATVVDPDGDPVTLDWSATYGHLAANGTSATFSADDGPAVATVSLTATDNHGAVGTGQATIAINNVQPSVSAGLAQTQYWGLPVFFVGAAADPSPVDQAAGLSPAWNFGDQQAATGTNVAHAYAKPGSYAAKFSAIDKDGASASSSVAVTIGKRGGTLAYTGAASAPYGFVTLQARLADSIDKPTAQLAGHSVLFMLGTQSLVATTDVTGLASVSSSSIAPGSYPVVVSLANDAYYNATAARTTVTVTKSLGRMTGTGLAFASGGSGSLSVTSSSTGVTGTLSYSSPSLSLSATLLGPLGIRADGHAAWLNGVDTTGRKLVVYGEDNGTGGSDVYKLWVNGTLVTGTGALTGGDVLIGP
jgi:hypothetical protein